MERAGNKGRYLKFFLVIAGMAVILAAVWFVFVSRPVSYSVKLSPKRVFVGDRVLFSAVIHGPLGTQFESPDLENIFQDLYIKDAHLKTLRKMGRSRFEIRFTLAAYELGSVELPQIPVRYRRDAEEKWELLEIGSLTFDVARLTDVSVSDVGRVRTSSSLSGAPGGAEQGSAGGFIDAPIRLNIEDALTVRKVKTGKDWVFIAIYSLAGIVVLFLAGIFIVAFFLSSREKRLPNTYEIAVSSLNKLEKARLGEKGDYKEFCSQLYSIMLNYVTLRFGITEIKMTAKEFISKLKNLDNVPRAMKEIIVKRIELCDTVKYSISFPGNEEMDYSLDKERQFIDLTSPNEEKGGEK